MKLKDAIELYKKEQRIPSNTYEWYRKSAKKSGAISIGSMSVPAYKHKGTWHVDDNRFQEAIENHRREIRTLKKTTADYSKGIIHGKDGDTIHTEWGGYEIRGGFRLVWSDHERLRMKSYATWYCNKCQVVAETEHEKEECHLCRDWNGCGRDCTLSKVYCPKCANAIII